MRVLFSTGSAARYMQPPQLGDEQINCGPDWPDERAPDGRIRSLATPVGDYDLAAIAAKLPPEQQPDVVVCLVDSSGRNRPRRLEAFRCPRVLLIADTHHLQSPLIGMLRYMAEETFDRRVLLYDRHHAALFRTAGFNDLFWLPGLTFPHSDTVVQAARAAMRVPRLAFVGQAARQHVRRARLLGALAERQVSVTQPALPQAEALAFYGRSLAGFNASLNGDLNLRVFEVLASGAALLTDRLVPGAGLDRLRAAGAAMTLYDEADDLAEHARHLLARPDEARSQGAAGARWFDVFYNETRRRELFRAMAFDGVAAPEFAFEPEETARVFFGGDTDRLLQTLMVFEGVQELHRVQEEVRVAADPSTPAEIGEICALLPRVRCETAGAGGAPDLAVFGREHAPAAGALAAPRLWCWDADDAEAEGLARELAPGGYALQSRDVAVFCRDEPIDEGAEIARARALLAQGDRQTALALARSVLEQKPRSIEARVLLGELALAQNGAALAEKLARDALELQPADEAASMLLARALWRQGKRRQAEKRLGRVLARHPQHAGAQRALDELRAEAKRASAADAAHATAPNPEPCSVG